MPVRLIFQFYYKFMVSLVCFKFETLLQHADLYTSFYRLTSNLSRTVFLIYSKNLSVLD